MVALVVLIIGICCILFGVVVQDKHQHFIRRSNKVFGRVVAFSEVAQQLGTGNDAASSIVLPMVEYEYGKKYRFIAESDFQQHIMKVGEAVEVYVAKENPKIAKLKQGTSQTEIIMRTFLIMGVLLCAIGLYAFELNDIITLIDGDTFYLLMSIALFSYVGAKLTPIMKVVITSPIYHENAFEVTEHDK